MLWTKSWQDNIEKWFNASNVPLDLKQLANLACNLDISDPALVGTYLDNVYFVKEKTHFTDEESNPENLSANLRQLAMNTDNLTEDLADAFSGLLEFGTAGLRGKMGAGLNRMNVYTIAAATAGIARYLLQRYGQSLCEERGVVIGYDTRYHSIVFAKTACLVFAAYGIRVNIFPEYCATPVLAYSIKPLGALAGLMVTASHNPKIYNGYKIYGEDGIQISAEEAKAIASQIDENYKIISWEEAVSAKIIDYVSKLIENEFIAGCASLVTKQGNEKEVKICYTPVHGTGGKYIKKLFADFSFTSLCMVAEQEEPDSDFSTAPEPNPEFLPAMKLLLRDAQKYQADLAIATDPDADRMAAVIPDPDGRYHLLSGNQIGALIAEFWFNYLQQTGQMPENPAFVKSIVTDTLAFKIARHYGLTAVESLTGFKSICGKIREFATAGSHNYVFGFEESIGYALNPKVLDKDGISASLVLASACAYWRKQNRSLWEVLQILYKRHGYHVSYTENLVREGQSGVLLMKFIMNKYRSCFPLKIAHTRLLYKEDFKDCLRSVIKMDGSTRIVENIKFNFEKSNVLRFFFENGSWYALRPSGTEPKLKIYFHSVAENEEEARDNLHDMKIKIMQLIYDLEAEFGEYEQHRI